VGLGRVIRRAASDPHPGSFLSRKVTNDVPAGIAAGATLQTYLGRPIADQLRRYPIVGARCRRHSRRCRWPATRSGRGRSEQPPGRDGLLSDLEPWRGVTRPEGKGVDAVDDAWVDSDVMRLPFPMRTRPTAGSTVRRLCRRRRARPPSARTGEQPDVSSRDRWRGQK
jgi:hypothetical protein